MRKKSIELDLFYLKPGRDCFNCLPTFNLVSISALKPEWDCFNRLPTYNLVSISALKLLSLS